MTRSKGAFEVTTEDGRVLFSKLKARSLGASSKHALRSDTQPTLLPAQMRRDPRSQEVVASIRTLMPGVGAPVDGFGGCA